MVGYYAFMLDALCLSVCLSFCILFLCNNFCSVSVIPLKCYVRIDIGKVHLSWDCSLANFDYHLMLSTLGKIFSRTHIEIFFLFSPRKQILTSHAMSNPLFWEK